MSLASLRIGGGAGEHRFVLGCAPLGNLFTALSDLEAHETLQAAWDNGVRVFDTAPHYGVGLAEERLGRFLREKPRSEFVVSTKVGRLLVATSEDVQGVEGFFETPPRTRILDYSAEGVRRSLKESCERMGLDQVDIALIHDPDDVEQQAMNESYRALSQLRDEGVVRAIGVGMNQVPMLERFARTTDIDCVLVAGRYSLLNDEAGDEFFSLMSSRGIDVLVGGVFNSGILANPQGASYDYRRAPRQVQRRVEGIAEVCARYNVRLPAVAMQYVLANRAVSAVVVELAAHERSTKTSRT